VTTRKIEEVTDALRAQVGRGLSPISAAMEPRFRDLVAPEEIEDAEPQQAGSMIVSAIDAAIDRIHGDRLLWKQRYADYVVRQALRRELALDSDALAFKRRWEALVMLGQPFSVDHFARKRNLGERELMGVLARELCQPVHGGEMAASSQLYPGDTAAVSSA
jgi:hypothetical protein